MPTLVSDSALCGVPPAQWDLKWALNGSRGSARWRGDVEGAYFAREAVEDAEPKLAGSRFQVHVLMDLEAGSRHDIELGSIQSQVKRCRDITFDDSAVSHAAATNVTSSVWR